MSVPPSLAIPPASRSNERHMHKDIPDSIDAAPQLPAKLTEAVRQSGLLPARSEPLVAVFQPYADRTVAILAEAAKVADNDPAAAKEVRLKLKKVRCDVETRRKEEKADSLKLGKAIDSVANIIFNVIQPVESHMDSIERAEEIKAQQAKLERANQRRAQLAEVGGLIPDALLLMEMNDESFEAMLAGAKLAKETRLAEEAKALAEAKQREEARLAEKARLREENERLAKVAAEAEAKRIAAEAEARKERERIEADAAKQRAAAAKAAAKAEAEARKEREALEAKVAKEREEREKLEAEAREREQAEVKRLAAEARAKARAERAPDKAKLLALVKSVERMDYPTMTTQAGCEALEAFQAVMRMATAKLTVLAEVM